MGTALIYMEEGVNLLQAKIVGFNANHLPTIQEVPWWQAGAAWALRIGAGWWGAANLFSLMIFSLGVSPIFRMGKRMLGDEGAWWVVAAFLAQPIVFLYAGTASPDGMSLVAALWAYDRIRAFAYKGGWIRAVIASVVAALAATIKLPFFMAAGIAVAFEVLWENFIKPAVWGRLACVATFSAIALLLWTRYTDSWLEKALWPLVDLRVGHNPEMVFWYFGDWAYRLSPAVWTKAIWRMANCLLGSFALGGVLVQGLCLRGNKEARAWLLGAVLTTAVFSHLVLHHSHYYLMFSPAVALAMGGGWMWLMKKCFPKEEGFSAVAGAGLILITFAALFQGLIGMKVVQQFDPYPKRIAKLVQDHTKKEDRLLIVGGGWGGDVLFRAKRNGLSIWNTQFLEDSSNLKKARDLGFSKLVVVRESPLLVALQKTNPGAADYSGEPFSHFLSPIATRWPPLYEDEQLII
ncbi:MAG: hypothetical protein EBU12_03880, partial [Microbacteriaceae bacterium]|nr:hypothetical protein [Microbacteriaceae bacterium]